MKALILAAGLGSRLQEYTSEVPKALVQVSGKPILGYQVEALLKNDVRRIVIVIGHQGHKIREFFTQNRYSELEVEYVENQIYNDSNSSYSFWLAISKIEGESYIHMNCDIMFSPELLQRVIHSDRDNVITLDRKITLTDNMEQVILEKDKIVKMRNYRLKGAVGKAVGLAKFAPDNVAWIVERLKQYIEVGDKNQNFYGIIREAVNYVDFYVLDAGEDLILEVNTKDDLRRAQEILARRSAGSPLHDSIKIKLTEH